MSVIRMGGPERAPQAPRRSECPGFPGALLDPPRAHGGGPEQAPQSLRRSEAPGFPGALRDPQGGFSLLEVLIALAILGTAVVVAIQGVSQGLRLLKVSGDQQQATVVADQKAREVITPIEGVDSGSEGRFSWQRVTRVVETPELTPADSPPKWRVFEIAVAVTWDEQRRVDVTTLRTVPATSDPTRDTTGSGGPTLGSGASRSPLAGPSSGSGGAGSSGGTAGGPGSGSGGRVSPGMMPSFGGPRR